MGKLIFPFLPVRLLVQNQYDSILKIGELNLPVLIIHSPDDELVPFEQGERLFNAAREPKEFLRIAGGHGDGFLITGEAYAEGIAEFLGKTSLGQ